MPKFSRVRYTVNSFDAWESFILHSDPKLIPKTVETPTQKLTVLSSFAGFDTAYAEAAINMFVPGKYIQGYNYMMVEKHLNSDKKKIIFTGPKGVGKSVCLVAYWHKFIKGGKKVILIGVNTIKMFFENHKIQHYLQSLKDFTTSDFKDESALKLALSAYIIKEDPIVL